LRKLGDILPLIANDTSYLGARVFVFDEFADFEQPDTWS